MADGSTPKNDDEIEAAVARAIGERPVCPHPPGLLGKDFCARCDAAAAMPVIRDQLARVRTDTIEECAKAVEDERMPQARSDPYWRGYDAAIMDGLAAIREVSHNPKEADEMSDEPYGWWLLECGHYGHDSDEERHSPTIRCRVCSEVEKFSGHVYRDRPDRRRVTAAKP